MTMVSFDLMFDCRVASEITMVVAARTRRTRVLLLRAPRYLECALHARIALVDCVVLSIAEPAYVHSVPRFYGEEFLFRLFADFGLFLGKVI